MTAITLRGTSFCCKQTHAAHCGGVAAATGARRPVRIVDEVRAVDADADLHAVAQKEIAPRLIDGHRVRLNGLHDLRTHACRSDGSRRRFARRRPRKNATGTASGSPACQQTVKLSPTNGLSKMRRKMGSIRSSESSLRRSRSGR